MTFGTEWGWGANETGAREMFNLAREAGINFYDTADVYTNGTSEEWLGKFIKESQVRDQSVIATKYSLGGKNANTGGNSRKSMFTAVEQSLRRLNTDHIDLFYLHVWDKVTPAEEVMRAFDDLISAGKIRYAALSDVPAWYAARAQSIAQFRGYEPIAALQLQYSLIERNIEQEFVDLGAALGAGIISWGPLGGGLLSGKYKTSEGRLKENSGRMAIVQDESHPAFKRLDKRSLAIISTLEYVAEQIGQSMASTAINWVANKAGVGSVLLGASKPEQLKDNIGALSFEIPEPLIKKLDNVSSTEQTFPYSFFEGEVQSQITSGDTVGSKHKNYYKQTLIESSGPSKY
jgi:aryl-alcohol dehydrogenase-like predicted oxidoreductase